MRKLTNFQKNNNQIITISAAITAFFISNPVYAQVKLQNAQTALNALQDDLVKNIIPVAAAVILLCLAIGYAGRYIERDTFIRWAVGVIIAGSATQLAKLLFTGVVN
ncbi:VirB2 family type IV secretion system major pilin TrwL [Bartonella sp. CM31XJBT]|uniref:VirB2 family type IV secretion system major pilin TrwL n=1 Tax=Bartonella sp. CM31XJBT TaxID=3019090 RepID=UPI002360102D|nr:VirB2 family type IV secretion system major pilin TrwL [Bartonella sp. CM31XJBT]